MASREFADLSQLTGIWVLDEVYQITRLLFRSDGRYDLQTGSTDSCSPQKLKPRWVPACSDDADRSDAC
jgi:hypothetical protein